MGLAAAPEWILRIRESGTLPQNVDPRGLEPSGPRTAHDEIAEQRGAAADAARKDVHKTTDVNDEFGTNVEQIMMTGKVERGVLKATVVIELSLDDRPLTPWGWAWHTLGYRAAMRGSLRE